MHIAAVDPGSEAYRHVLTLYRKNAATLGVMPKGAFEERAVEGTLIAAFEDDAVIAYALYALPAQHISLSHLCVEQGYRRRGIGAELVAAIERSHPERRGIRVRCRRDFDASRLWEALDFMPRLEKPGRSSAGHLVTSWWKDFGHEDLFTYVPDSSGRALVALDTDVFLDLDILERDGAAEESRQVLLSDWVLDEVELGLTPEVSAEINHGADAGQRKHNWGRTEGFISIRSRSSAWRRDEAAILEVLPQDINEHQRADVRHVARAAAGGARFLVTRDGETLARLRAPALELLGLRVMRPLELAHLIGDQDLGYVPASIQGTAYRRRLVRPDEERTLAGAFVDHGAGERAARLRTRLRVLLADPRTWRSELVEDQGGHPVALVVTSTRRDELEVPVLRLTGAESRSVSRPLAFGLREQAAAEGRKAVIVTEPVVSPAVVRSLEEEAFAQVEGGWRARVIVDVCTSAELWETLGAPDDARALAVLDPWVSADIEHRLWPAKVIDSELPTYLMPIRPHWAAALFDVDLADATLFRRPSALGLAREHVYYRSPKKGVKVPARILWYVSAGAVGSKAIRACSLLREVSIDRPRTLHRRFRRLGIYSTADVESEARQGEAMALRFSDTELFANPVTLRRLRELSEPYCLSPFLQSDWLLPPALFADIYREGSIYGRV